MVMNAMQAERAAALANQPGPNISQDIIISRVEQPNIVRT